MYFTSLVNNPLIVVNKAEIVGYYVINSALRNSSVFDYVLEEFLVLFLSNKTSCVDSINTVNIFG